MVRVGGVGRRGRTLGFDCLERQPHIPTKEQLGHNYIPVRRTRPSKNVSMIKKKRLSRRTASPEGYCQGRWAVWGIRASGVEVRGGRFEQDAQKVGWQQAFRRRLHLTDT